jgi:uroporphyrinogen-III synthase
MGISKYIITTRPAIKFNKLETECIDIKNVPLTDIMPCGFKKEIADEIIENDPRLIVLTSSYGAAEFFKNYYEYTKNPDFIAIGEKTAEIIKKYTGKVSVPTGRDSYGVNDLISKYRDLHIALFRSNESNNIIRDSLARNRINFREYYIYKIIKLENTDLRQLFLSDYCIGILITSSMEAITFHENAGDNVKGKKIYSIGKITTKTLESLGYTVYSTGNSDFESMIMNIDKINCQ